MAGNSVSFTPFTSAHTKFVVLGPSGVLGHRITNSVRSLNNFEHVNATAANREGDVSSSYDTRSTRALREMRHWFFGRRKSHGFLLEGFPSTVQQALVLDEWLDARDETLTACLWFDLSLDDAMVDASARLTCPNDCGVAYARDGEPVECASCGTLMLSDKSRAQAEVNGWFQSHQTLTVSLASYYQDSGQLWQFDASDADVADVSEIVENITAR